MQCRRLLVPATLSLALVLTACSEDEPTVNSAQTGPATSEPTSTSSPSAPAEDEDADAAAPEFAAPGTLFEEEGEPVGGLTVVDVRTGTHDGYDRVVFELEGEGSVGWRVEYDDDPREQGSGDQIDVPGDATVAVLLSGVGYPFDTGIEEFAGPREAEFDYPAVRGYEVGAVFEGYYDAFVGVAERLPYRVFTLDNPRRVVVDVQHPGNSAA